MKIQYTVETTTEGALAYAGDMESPAEYYTVYGEVSVTIEQDADWGWLVDINGEEVGDAYCEAFPDEDNHPTLEQVKEWVEGYIHEHF